MIRYGLVLFALCSACDLEFVERLTRVQPGTFEDGVFIVPLNRPVQEQSLPEEGAARDASIYLLSFDREQVPVTVETVESMILVTPLSPLEMGEAYALVVTDAVRNEVGSRIGRERDFHDAYVGEDGADPALRASLLEVRALLVRDRRELTPVVGVVRADP